MLGASLLLSLGRALAGKGRAQRAADLAALSAARSMRDDFERLFEPPLVDGRPNPYHLTKARYLARARAAALAVGAANDSPLRPGDVTFPRPARHRPGAGEGDRPQAVARTASRRPPWSTCRSWRVPSRRSRRRVARQQPLEASGSGYDGPLAYRQGKPMRPDVARAFDRMEAAARADGVRLIVTSGYRSDAEQAELFARHPDPKWVAPPGKSLHRLGHRARPRPAGRLRLARAQRRSLPLRPALRVGALALRLHAEPALDACGHGRRRRSQRGAVVRAGRLPWRRSRARRAAGTSRPRCSPRSSTRSAASTRSRSVPPGARGIAQFMPGTGARLRPARPVRRRAAIDAQAHLMRDLLRRFGTVPLALAAYNAGPGAVAACGCIPPYPETRAYVARVLGADGRGGGGAARRAGDGGEAGGVNVFFGAARSSISRTTIPADVKETPRSGSTLASHGRAGPRA